MVGWFAADAIYRWYRQPELTLMELVLAYWWRYLMIALGVLTIRVGAWLESSET